MIDDTRGVSEILGFVLIFALVTSMIAVVFTVGFAGLQSSQQAEQVNNVERAFDVFADNLRDLYQRDNFEESEMSRATEIKLIGGTISLQESTTIRVEGENLSFSPRSVVYSDDSDTEIVYEAGAVFRSDGYASVMLVEPNFHFGEKRSIIHVVNPRDRSEHGSIERVGTVLIVAEYRDSTVFEVENSESVNVTIESPRSNAWKRYFESQDLGYVKSYSEQNNSVTYTFSSDEVTFIETRIGIQLRD